MVFTRTSERLPHGIVPLRALTFTVMECDLHSVKLHGAGAVCQRPNFPVPTTNDSY